MYNTVDVPNITSDQLAGVITSGKTIRALYWGLTVRCDEKMLAWGHALEFIATAIIEGGLLYPQSIRKYTHVDKLPEIPFTVFAHAADIFRYKIDKINKLKEMTNDENCKAVFTLGEYHKNYLLERNVPKEKIVITKQATGYKLSPLKQNDREIKEIISISRLVEKKGIDILVDASKILENENLHFSIYGEGILEEDLNSQIKELNLDKTELKGLLNGPEEVKKTFAKSDILVAPCRIAKDGDMDGFPTVIFEAMAYGIPVITTDVSTIPEVIKDGVNGFIVPQNNPEALAQKILMVRDMPKDDLFKIIKQAQKDVAATSSVEKTMNVEIDTWKNIK